MTHFRQEYLSVGLDTQRDVEQRRGAAGPVMDGQNVIGDVERDPTADERRFLQQKRDSSRFEALS